MNRMIKLFQQKSNRKFEEYLLAKKKSLSTEVPTAAYQLEAVICSVLKAESNVWAAAADLLRQEEMRKCQ